MKFICNPTINNRVVSPLGYRASTGTTHAGVDLGPVKPGVPGDKLIAVVAARVAISKINGGGINTGYGNYCVLEHDNGAWCTLYGHQQRLETKVGQLVKPGDVIGHMGYTGHCEPAGPAGTHTHFEVRLGPAATFFTNKYVDPVPYFAKTPIVMSAGPLALYGVTPEEEAALDKLVKFGIISSKEYWLTVMENTKYFDQLILNMAKYLK